IFGKLKHATASRCQSQRSFYLLRRALVSISGADRNSIGPESPIRRFVGRHQERFFWERLRHEVSTRVWPGLAYAGRVETAGKIAFISFCIYALTVGWRLGFLSSAGGIAGTILLLGLFIPAILISFVSRLLSGFKSFIPTRISSVRDLVPYVATSDRIDW